MSNQNERIELACTNAIARAGIDWRKLEEDPDALAVLIRRCDYAYRKTELDHNVEMIGEALDRLGVRDE